MSTKIKIEGEVRAPDARAVRNGLVELVAATTRAPIVSVTISERGSFAIALPRLEVERLLAGGELIIHVFVRGRCHHRSTLAWPPTQRLFLIAGDAIEGPTPSPARVFGRTIDVPVGSTIRLMAGSGKTQRSLGETRVDRDGGYEIAFEATTTRRDLRVCALDAKGIVLAESEIARAALSTVELDLEAVPAKPQRFARARRLAQTGADDADARLAAASERLAKRVGISEAAAFGLSRAGLSVAGGGFASNRPAEVASAIAQARADGDLDLDDAGAAKLLQSLEQRAIGDALSSVRRGPAASLHAAIAGSTLSRAHQERLVALSRQGESALRDAIAKDGTFDAESRKQALRIVAVAALVDEPAVAMRVLARRDADVSGLAALDVDDWERLVGKDVPAPFAGSTRDYAVELVRRVERDLPGPFFARRLEREGSGGAASGTLRVLDHPDFTLGKTPVATFLGRHRELLGDDAGLATRQLRTLERLHRISPHFDDVRRLASRHDSAASIACRSRRSFVRRNAAMGEDRAIELHMRAEEVYAESLGRGAALHPQQLRTGVRSIDGDTPPDIASWETLFGSLDFCACDHCRSVLGPAAYFVDLLEYLERHDGIGAKTEWGGQTDRFTANGGTENRSLPVDDPSYRSLVDALGRASSETVDVIVGPDVTVEGLARATTGALGMAKDSLAQLGWAGQYAPSWGSMTLIPQTARDLLTQRRPDLRLLELSCENTNKVVPQIDLAIELLEVAVVQAASQPVAWPSHITTEGDPEDLAVRPAPGPAHDLAESILADREFPFTAPYEAWTEETMLLLEHLGVPWHELVFALQRPQDPSTPPVLSPTPGSSPTPVPSPAPIGGGINPSLLPSPAYVRACAQLGLCTTERTAYREPVVSCTAAAWGFAGSQVDIRDPGTPGKRLLGPWLGVLSRVSVLLARTGLSFQELSIALEGRALAAGEPRPRIVPVAGADPTTCDPSQLEVRPFVPKQAGQLVRLLRLRRALGWSLAELDKVVQGLGGDIDEDTIVTLARIDRLRRRFRRPVLEIAAWWTLVDRFTNPSEEAPSLFTRTFLSAAVANPAPEGLGPFSFDGALADHATSICAALSIAATDLDALVAAHPDLAGDVSHARLSQIFRHASLARVLRTSVANVLALVGLARLDPFESPDAAERFIDLGRAFVGLRLSGDDLAYLLQHRRRDRASVALDEVTNTATLAASEVALRAIDEALAPARAALAASDPAAPPVDGDDGAREILIAPARELLAMVLQRELVEPAVRAVASGVMDAEVLAALAAVPGLEDVAVQLAALGSSTARLAHVVAALVVHVRTVRATRAIVECLSSATRLDADVAHELLTGQLRAVGDDGFAIDDFLREAPATVRLAQIERLHKAAVLCTRANITGLDLPDVVAWLPFDRIPSVEREIDPGLFEGVLRLVELAGVRRRFPGGASALREVLATVRAVPAGSATIDDVVVALAERTDWNADDIARVAARLRITLPGNLADPRDLDRLSRACELLRALGISAVTALGWIQLPTNATQGRKLARQIRDAAVARHGHATWRTVGRPLVDKLRERRRDVLVAHLVHALDLASSDELHGHLLVDTQVNACAMTSRIRLAIASVQLFVQRCFLGLEPGVALGSEAGDEWEWMKAYRVWEANRKVFLWPENWLYPELRADKSHLFEALETAVAAGGLDGATAEAALRRYVEGLCDIARLELMGMYRHRRWGAEDIVYVVGRTTATSPRYYLCTCRESMWSAWRPIDLDVQGPHCFPVVLNERLYLVWSQVEPVASKIDSNKDDIEIRIAWASSRRERWSAIRRSEPVRVPVSNPSFGARYYTDKVYFVSAIEDGHLVVRCAIKDANNSRSDIWVADFTFDAVGDQVTTDQKVATDLEMYSEAGAHARTWRARPNKLHQRFDRWEFYHAPWFGFGTYERGSWNLPDDLSLTEPHPTSEMDGYVRDELLSQITYVEIFAKIDPRDTAMGNYTVVVPHQYEQYVSQDIAFIWDQYHTFLVQPLPAGTSMRYWIRPFEHTFARDMLYALESSGPPALYGAVQRRTREIMSQYQLVAANAIAASDARISFARTDAYSIYNWEIYLHIPLLIADRLTKNRRFEDARRWLHAIFDPTSGNDLPVPQRFWNLLPFRNTSVPKSIDALLEELAGGSDALLEPIAEWRKHPFEPHELARARHTAYQKNVVMRYVDNLIAWADDLFRRDTGESVDEAATLYLFAAEILGPRPQRITRAATPERTYAELAPHLDAFSNALVELEATATPLGDRTLQLGSAFGYVDAGVNDMSMMRRADSSVVQRVAEDGHRGLAGELVDMRERRPEVEYGAAPSPKTRRVPPPRVLYFCVPPNEKLLERWDIVADRLFKIRCCMNIDGARRDLPLFEPPVDPELLVRARAAGLDLSQVVADLDAPLPRARFTRLLQLAKELAAEVRALGASLLAAREKLDAETLTRLRSTHELAVLAAVRDVRREQIAEANQQLAALRAQRTTVDFRRTHYGSLESLNELEKRHTGAVADADRQTMGAAGIMFNASAAQGMSVMAGSMQAVSGPQAHQLTQIVDSQLLQSYLMSRASALETEAGAMRSQGGMLATHASYKRRQEEWKLQEDLAAKELLQIDRQILAAEIRVALAERELANLELQREHARDLDQHVRDKFTGAALYEWMSAQLAAVYFSAYDLATAVARKAERAFQFELGRPDARFVEPGGWDGLHEGLLAGERLARDLHRMEIAHVDQRDRELQLRRHVSLALHDPAGLIALKTTGHCTVTLPETLFDADYPGHYFRRLRRVAISIPCVVGPFSPINCTLTLLDDAVRIEPRIDEEDPSLLRRSGAPIDSIVTSSGQLDGAMIDLVPVDQLQPFEGAGAVSRWRIELPPDTNDFDLGELNDVVLRLDYTARDGGEQLRQGARARLEELRTSLTAEGGAPLSPRPLRQLFSLKHQLPNEWRAFLAAASGPAAAVDLPIARERFPYLFRGRDISIHAIAIAWLPRRTLEPSDGVPGALGLAITPPVGAVELAPLPPLEMRTVALQGVSTPGTWRLAATRAFDAAVVDDLLLVMTYTV